MKKNKPERSEKKKSFISKILSVIIKFFGVLLVLFLLGLIAAGVLFIYYTKDMPRPEDYTEKNLAQSTKIFDRTGNVLLYEIYGEEKRSWVPLNDIPDHLRKMAVATEDANFYNHFGIDPRGIARAIWVDLQTQKATVGGSTIPQQLIRSTYLTNEKTTERKIREMIMAIELDRRYSKDQILEWYLNQVPFGKNSYGVEAASESYFGKPVSQVNLGEAATLIALIQAPSYYSAHTDDLLKRKNYVIGLSQRTKSLVPNQTPDRRNISIFVSREAWKSR